MDNFFLPNNVRHIGCYLNRLAYSYMRRDFVSLLDVGCGGGNQLLFFKSRGFKRLVGCDINVGEELYNYEDIEIHTIDLNSVRELPFANDEFDVVISYHVLEHIKQPKLIMKEMVRVSKELVLVVIPAGNSYDSPDHIHTWETFGDVANALLLPEWTFSIELAISKIADVVLEQAGFIICVYKSIIDKQKLVHINSSTTNFPMVINVGVGL